MSKRNPSVLWTVEQGLNTDEKAQARSNIGVADAISGAINALDAEEVSTDGINVQFQVTETDGKITGVSVTTDNTVNATDVSNAITTAINGLDSNATSNDGTNVQVKVTETDGKISAVNITSDNTVNSTDVSDAITTAINDLDSDATSTDGTNVQVKVTETDGKITGVNITSDNTVNSTDVSDAITTAINDLDSNATSNDGTNVQVKVTETDGKITGVNITSDNTVNSTDVSNAITTAINGLDSDATSNDGTNVQVKVTETDGKITGVSVTTDNTVNATDVSNAITTAINDLDSDATSNDGTNVQVKVTETDGKISAVNITSDHTVNSTDVSNAITTAINDLDSDATSNDGTNVQFQVTETDGKITGISVTTDNTVNATDVSNAITTAINDLDSTATSNDGTNVQVKVTETDGKISAVNITSDNTVNATDVSNAITTAIGNLDVPATGTGAITGFGANKTLATLTEDNGKIAATFQNIALGNINHEGKIGTEANKVIVTGANGVLTTGETSDSTELQSSTTLATAQAAYTADKIVYITMENTADDIQAILDAGKYPVLVVTGNNGVAYIPFIRSTDIGWGSTNNRYQFKISCGGDLSHMPDRTSVQYICTANSTPQWSGPYITSDEYVSNDPRIIVNNNSITLARDSALSTNNIYSSQYQGINAVTNYQKIATCTFTKSSQQNDWLYTVYQLELVVSEIGYCDGVTQHKWDSDHSGRFSLAIAVEQIRTTLFPEIVHGQWIYYTNRSIPIKLKSLRVYKTTDGDSTTFELWLYQDHAQDLSFKVLQNNRYDSSIENLGDHRDPIHQQMNPWNITALTSGMRDTEPGGTLLGSWDPSTAPEYVPSYTNANPGDSLVVNASGTGLEWSTPDPVCSITVDSYFKDPDELTFGSNASHRTITAHIDTDYVTLGCLVPATTIDDDGRYLKATYVNNTPVLVWADSGSGNGDVVGPSSSTDSRIPLFDGTTGKLLKDSQFHFSTYAMSTSGTDVQYVKTKSYYDVFPSSQQILADTTNNTVLYIGNQHRLIRLGIDGSGNVVLGDQSETRTQGAQYEYTLPFDYSPSTSTTIIGSSGTGNSTTYHFYGLADKASKIDTSYAIGSGSQPVYVAADGTVTECVNTFARTNVINTFTTTQEIARNSAQTVNFFVGNTNRRFTLGVDNSGQLIIGEDSGKTMSPTSDRGIITSGGTGDSTVYYFHGSSDQWGGYSIDVGHTPRAGTSTIYFT